MTDHISHKRPQRQIAVNESGLSCALHVRSTQKTPDCLRGHAIMSGNLTKRFVLLTDTAHYVWPFFRWDAMLRLTRTWMLLCRDDRGKTAKQLLQCKRPVIELAMRSHKMDQHW